MFDEFLPKQSSAKPTGKTPVLPTKEERAGTGMFDEFLQPSQQAPLQRADDLHKQGRYAEAFQLYQGLAVQGDARVQPVRWVEQRETHHINTIESNSKTARYQLHDKLSQLL
jgi:hypothetical protein